MMSATKARVILFKQVGGAQAQGDKYEKLLTEYGFKAEFVPTLSFAFCHEPELQDALRHPHSYRGVLFTSQRAVDAAVNCIGDDASLGEWREELGRQWNERLVCSVGTATKEAAAEKLGLHCSLGDTGNAEQLADELLQRLSEEKDAATSLSHLPFLFPCGDLHRDVLPNKLRVASYEVDELVSYQTAASPGLEDRCRGLADEILAAAPAVSAGDRQLSSETFECTWLVFFSPSGVGFSVPPLLSRLPDLLSSSAKKRRHLKVAAIGRTTGDALRQQGIAIDAIASQPTAVGLLEAMSRNTET